MSKEKTNLEKLKAAASKEKSGWYEKAMKRFYESQRDIDPEIKRIVNKRFWDMI